ncbi:hypothetical protein RD792_007136 [Penstemon davidsonii]|uniref:Uncharacterized protein n=1 Tax=Penstemon davidsonii TaxID=160366 RepID=A0ABR0D5L5_9LAMI|nr:hypothetical protein RD792_007136 [Penstemon davidsonii]
MESSLCYRFSNSTTRFSNGILYVAGGNNSKKPHNRQLKIPKNLRYPRRTQIPPDFHPILHPEKESIQLESTSSDSEFDSDDDINDFKCSLGF